MAEPGVVVGAVNVQGSVQVRVRVRYFASLREALGEGETVEVQAGSTVADLRAVLQARGGAHAEVLAVGRAVRTSLVISAFVVVMISLAVYGQSGNFNLAG